MDSEASRSTPISDMRAQTRSFSRSLVFTGIVAMESLNVLKSQIDRMPSSKLVEEIADFLHANWEAER
jgi:hypothetical protein